MLNTFKAWLKTDEERSAVDRALFWLAWLLHVPLLVFLPINLMDGNLRNINGNILAILISFVPRWMEARSRYHFPAVGELAISLSMLAELFGRTFHLYE